LKNKRAMFVTDDRRGQGHLVRSRALADELFQRGWRVSLVNEPLNNYSVADVVIVDGYCFGSDVYTEADGIPRVVIADHPVHSSCGRFHHDDRDYAVALLVNGTAAGYGGEKYERYGIRYCAPLNPKKVLAGPAYALLRPEFREYRPKKEEEIFQRRQSGSYRCSDLRAVQNLTAGQLALQLADSRMALTYCGMRAMEAACVGVPMVLVERGADEELNAVGLATEGCAKLVRSDTWASKRRDVGDEKAEVWLADIVNSGLNPVSLPSLVEMSKKCLSLVDGLGCSRVADAIGDLV